MGFTTSYWQKERLSRPAADTLTSYGRCWNPSLGNWDVNWRVGVSSEEQTPQVIVFSGKGWQKKKSKKTGFCATRMRTSPALGCGSSICPTIGTSLRSTLLLAPSCFHGSSYRFRLVGAPQTQFDSKRRNASTAETKDYARAFDRAFDWQQRCRLG